ncbi:MAG: hypothetical protein GY865_11760 [candidate division Zixibacteria bacterium]|nr:hypothetical protein [candidate division Zixibacteria bacterium]
MVKPNKVYLCIEDGERFTVEATDMEDAREKASMWNAQVIRELKPSDLK